MTKIIFATGNKDKLREIKEILSDCDVDIRSMKEAGINVDIVEDGKTFKYGYRNVIVVKKMTFPNDKVLTIELSEKQISGRTISLSIDYEDVLSADSFNHILLEEE